MWSMQGRSSLQGEDGISAGGRERRVSGRGGALGYGCVCVERDGRMEVVD
jgi:hypothetical protein